MAFISSGAYESTSSEWTGRGVPTRTPKKGLVTRTLAAAMLVLTTGCGDNHPTVPATPTSPSPPTQRTGATWSIRGTVTDSLLILANARVEVVAGVGAGASTTSAESGTYRLVGAAGDVEVRASLPGFESQIRRFHVSADRMDINFALMPLNPANVAGAWRLTIEASPLCQTLLESVRTRTYQAVVDQSGARATVRFVDDKVLASTIEAVIYDRSVRLAVGLNPYDPRDGFRERVAADTVLSIFGWVPETTLTPSRISGRLDAYIATYEVPLDATLDDLLRVDRVKTSCSSADHRFTLER